MDTGRNGTFIDSGNGIFGNRRVLGASCVEQSKALRGVQRKQSEKYSPSCQGEADVGVDLIICVLLSMVSGGVILAAILWMWKKRRELLETEEPLSYVDDDIYWKNGWYNNPNDRRWMIQDRMCSSNYSLNMGKPGARYLTGIGIVAIALAVLWMLVVFFQMDFVRPGLQIEKAQVSVRSAEYGITFEREDIREIELLEDLPEEEF